MLVFILLNNNKTAKKKKKNNVENEHIFIFSFVFLHTFIVLVFVSILISKKNKIIKNMKRKPENVACLQTCLFLFDITTIFALLFLFAFAIVFVDNNNLDWLLQTFMFFLCIYLSFPLLLQWGRVMLRRWYLQRHAEISRKRLKHTHTHLHIYKYSYILHKALMQHKTRKTSIPAARLRT